MRRFTGVLAVEGSLTGDGRVIAEGAIYWPDGPLPLAWLRDGDQHIMPTEAPQVGVIETIRREGNLILGEGVIDDANPDGAEVVRKMDEGSAPFGTRFGVSIDADDWEIQVIATEPVEADEEVILIASGAGPMPNLRRPTTADAGDPDPAGDGDAATLFEDSAESIVERATRLRIRGATLCAVPAFAEAYIELTEAQTEPETEPAVEPESVAAHAGDIRPPAEFFTNPNLSELQRWVTITDEGRVYGHLAAWGECHIGYTDRCLTPEMLSEGGFDYATPGHVVTSDGTKIATGPIAVKGGHANPDWDWRAASAHYDDPSTAVVDVAYFPDEYGIAYSGALRPTASEEQVYALRASGVSGDWRPIGGKHRLIGACCVNTPGYPKLQLRVAASGEPLAIVAAGGRPKPDPALGLDCGCDQDYDRLVATVASILFPQLDSRTGWKPTTFADLDERVGV